MRTKSAPRKCCCLEDGGIEREEWREEWKDRGMGRGGEGLPQRTPGLQNAQPPEGGRDPLPESAETLFSGLFCPHARVSTLMWGEDPKPALNARTCCPASLTFPRGSGTGRSWCLQENPSSVLAPCEFVPKEKVWFLSYGWRRSLLT